MATAHEDSYRLARALDRVVRRVNANVMRAAGKIDMHGVGPMGGMALLALADLEPCPIQSLCSELGRDSSQMTRVLRVLETNGLIERRTSAEDKRISWIALTDTGKTLVNGLRMAMGETLGPMASRLTARERKSLIAMLDRLSGSTTGD